MPFLVAVATAHPNFLLKVLLLHTSPPECYTSDEMDPPTLLFALKRLNPNCVYTRDANTETFLRAHSYTVVRQEEEWTMWIDWNRLCAVA